MVDHIRKNVKPFLDSEGKRVVVTSNVLSYTLCGSNVRRAFEANAKGAKNFPMSLK
jgi:hypothetical protein